MALTNTFIDKQPGSPVETEQTSSLQQQIQQLQQQLQQLQNQNTVLNNSLAANNQVNTTGFQTFFDTGAIPGASGGAAQLSGVPAGRMEFADAAVMDKLGSIDPNKLEVGISDQVSQAATQAQSTGTTGLKNDFGLTPAVASLGGDVLSNEMARQGFLADAQSTTPAFQTELERAYNTATGGPTNTGIGRAARSRIGAEALKEVGAREQGLRIGAAQTAGTTNALTPYMQGAAPFFGQETTADEKLAGVTTGQSFARGVGNIPKAETVQQSSGGGGGMSVICSEMARQRLVSKRVLLGASEFGASVNRRLYEGYRMWALPTVRLMRLSPLATKLIAPAARAWAQEMAFQMGRSRKGSLVGKALLFTYGPVCEALGALKEILDDTRSVTRAIPVPG